MRLTANIFISISVGGSSKHQYVKKLHLLSKNEYLESIKKKYYL